jgi:Prokaryotic cytochrome b561
MPEATEAREERAARTASGAVQRVRFRNGDHGYGVATKVLHWLTVAAILGQFFVGYTMDLDQARDRQRDQFDVEAERLEEGAEGNGEATEERVEAEIEQREDAIDAGKDDQAAAVFGDVVTGKASDDGLSLPEVHVGLGLLVIALAVVRLLWRRTTPLPPWAEHLSTVSDGWRVGWRSCSWRRSSRRPRRESCSS